MVAAEAAVQQNPRSKEAATLLGYVYIGLVGFEPMQVIKKMSKSQDSSGEETSSQEGAENKDSPAESNGGEKGAATGGLDKVKDIISVTEEDLLKLGEVDDSDPELPIIEPFCADGLTATQNLAIHGSSNQYHLTFYQRILKNRHRSKTPMPTKFPSTGS